MAVDSAGWSTNSALASGLQSAATYDPTQQSTSTPTSVAGLQQGLNSQSAATPSPSTTQNVQSTPDSAPQTVANYGVTATSNNTPYQSPLVSKIVTPVSQAQTQAQSPQGAVSSPAVSSTSMPTASAITPNSVTYGSNTATYQGPQVLKDGASYYVFDPQTGAYTFAGGSTPVFDSSYHITGYTFKPANGVNLTGNQIAGAFNATTLANDPNNQATAAQRLQSIMNSSAIGGNLAAYNKDLQNARAAAQAATTASAASAAQQTTLDYLTTHGGQLSAQDQAVMNASLTAGGLSTDTPQQQANIQAALSAYQAQQAQAAQLTSIGIKPIDTSAVDATNNAAMASLISQYASNNAAGAPSGAGAYNASALSGQNSLNHDIAAATSYNANIANYNNALGVQFAADKQGTGNQLYSDVQNVQQIAAQLQQEIGQLGTAQSQQAQSALNQLTGLLQQYQQSVAQYGQGSQQARAVATSILSAGGGLAALV